MERKCFRSLPDQLNDTDSIIISMALKQVSKGRFEIENNEIISIIRFHKIEMKIVFTNEISVEVFRNKLCCVTNDECSLEFMHKKTDGIMEWELIPMVKKYKEKYYLPGSKMENEICFKLYSKEEIKEDKRELYQVEWIDYDKQLSSGNVIYDIYGVNGLFAIKSNWVERSLSEETENRYGRSLLILKPIVGCYYLDDEKEIIGDRFKVIDKFEKIDDKTRRFISEKIHSAEDE